MRSVLLAAALTALTAVSGLAGAQPMAGQPMPGMSMSEDKPSPAKAAMVGALPSAAPGTVVLTGLGGKTETLTQADIAKLPHEQVSLPHGDKITVYSGPRLDDLLRDIDVPMGSRIHGTGVNDVLFVTGSDRYRVVLSLAEVDPSFHKGARVILADQADGKPLDAHDGPFRLVIDGDLKPSRSVHSVVAIDLKHLP
jgi:hypothetical protein